MLKVWVVGSNGQIGTAINEVIEPLEIEVLNTDQDEFWRNQSTGYYH